jgi:sulfite reductase (ferredoxin)
MACPALPTCGLALAEAERALPAVIDRLELELAALGLGGEKLTIRMTGCPNGCARPYVADLAFVGRSLDRYLVLVGGRRDGSRLNRTWLDLVPTGSLVDAVLPLFRLFRDRRDRGESFGDFCDRIGLDALRAQAAAGREAAANE